MANNPLIEVRTNLKEAYDKRKTRLVDGSGEFPLWKATDPVKDVKKANNSAGDMVGPAMADSKNPDNMIPAFRKANMLLALARDRGAFGKDRIARGGEYISLLEFETDNGLEARMPK